MSLGLACALAAAIAYGAADFCGGLASRRSPTTAVLVVSQLAGLAFLTVVLFLTGGVSFAASDVPIALAAGFSAATGIGLLYAALAVGRMSVVSPITAVVSACVPVAVSLARGDRIGPIALGGLALALIAILAITTGGKDLAMGHPASASNRERAWFREPGVLAALGSGVAIGMLYVALAQGRANARLMIVGEMRLVSIPLLAAFALLTRRPLLPSRPALPLIVFCGLLDMAANLGYVFAARLAPLAIAAVVTSLYPASTVMLAVVALRERLSRVQVGGVCCAALGVAAIARGG